MIVELKDGEGKLLICSADINTPDKNRPDGNYSIIVSKLIK